MIRLHQRSDGEHLLWAIAGVGAVFLMIGAVSARQPFFEAYLFAFLFYLSLSLGALVIGMIGQITGGRWSIVVRGPALAAAGALPLLALLFVPVLFGLDHLYPWLTDMGASPVLLQHKQPYLNRDFFIMRAVLYFTVWIGIGLGFVARLRKAERDATASAWQDVRRLCLAGLILYALTGSLAAVDWLMSLLPEWYSTVFAVQVLMVQLLSASALVVLSAGRMQATPGSVDAGDYHDLGNLMLLFTLLWAYLAYSDFLTIWIADLPHETAWYRQRAAPVWEGLGVAVWALQFALPFVLLLFRGVKRHAARLKGLAMLVLCGGLLNLYWLTMPSLRIQGPRLSWLDVVVPIALGATWTAWYLLQWNRYQRQRSIYVEGGADVSN